MCPSYLPGAVKLHLFCSPIPSIAAQGPGEESDPEKAPPWEGAPPLLFTDEETEGWEVTWLLLPLMGVRARTKTQALDI